MSKTCLAIRHVAFEDLGVFEAPLLKAGYEISLIDATRADAAHVDPLQPDLMVLLGGPIGVYETETYPFLENEIAWARARLQERRPTLGLCLGAQIMTVALGADVRPGTKEIGVAPIQVTTEGQTSPLRHLTDHTVLHWHGDAMRLPPNARHLARTDACEVQAWSLGQHALALQFHAEANPARIDDWLVGHAFEISASGLDPRDIRRDMDRDGAVIASAGTRMLTEWLAQLPS